MSKLQEASATMREWRTNPSSFVKSQFGVTPDVWQDKALRAFVDESPEMQRIALSACAGPGKSACIAWCALLFLSCYVGEKKPVGIVVSASWDTLQDTIWKELIIWLNKSTFLKSQFSYTKSKIYHNDYPEDWCLVAKTYRKSADENEQGRTLQGFHSSHIAYFIDESGDMGVPVLQGAEQGLSNCVFGKIITAGNPTSHQGLLHYAVVEDAENWHVITISGDPDDPDRSPRINIDQARKMIEKFGRDDAWVMAYILGKFPKSAINTLLSPEEVRDAIKRGQASDLTACLYEKSQKRLGIDIALYGDDKTVIFPRQGLRAFKPLELRNTASEGEAPAQIAAAILSSKEQWKSEMEFVDCTGGYGDGVVNYLIDAGATPTRVVYSTKATKDEVYVNKRTEMYFRMRDWIRRGGILPNDNELVKELSSPTYTLKNGKLALEPKDRIKERIKRSPDKADALCQTFFIEDMAAAIPSIIPDYDFGQDIQSSDWEPNYE